MFQKKYYTGLDILRLLAACGVVFFHYFLTLTDELSWYRYGNLGVHLFFIISGFVIANSVSRTTFKEFALGRFIRLYPMFWIACTTTYLVTLLMPNGHPVLFPEYLISMTMLGEKFGNVLGYTGLVDGVYWTLSVELIFYIAIGIFVYLFSWRRITFFLWGWLAISALSFLFHINNLFIFKLLLVRHASYFIIGIGLSLITSKYENKLKPTLEEWFLLGITLTYSTFISFIALPPYFKPNPLDDYIIAFAHPILFLLVVLGIYGSQFFQSKRIIMISGILGGLTYPIYLLHQTIGRTFIDYFKDKASLFFLGTYMFIFIVIVSLLFYLIDKKVRFLLRKKIGLRVD